MMKLFIPSKLVPYRQLFLTFVILTLAFYSANSQSFKGRDGAKTYSLTGTYILNRYTALGATVSAGAASLTVANIAELSGSYSFAGGTNPYANDALSQGDLIMIMQVQGADITTTDDANYGTVTNYNNTGAYELKTVFNVAGNTIYLCQGLNNTYTQNGRSRAQVIRIPRLSTLTVNTGVTVTGLPWSGTSGGVIAIESDGDVSNNGIISANALGFRGGTDDITSSIASGSAPLLLYTTTATNTTAGKGESIAGNSSDYLTLLNGANGRGAPANGGGGGNGHNSGGGGGSNAGINGVLTGWNGTGVKSVSNAAWSGAWNLETASFATNVSPGAGRGGYSYSNSNQDALTVGPGNTLWGGNNRINVGGFGGRPLDYGSNSKLFLGGGGGAGDGNNLSAGNGGNGAGVIYVFAGGNVSGTGSVTANGQNGYSTILTNIDAAGGAGGGGAIVFTSKGSITGISMQANGGKGGDQLYLTGEAEGPGGGGGAGYIGTTSTSISRQVVGGVNGVSNSAHVTEFLPNGATQGSAGTIAGKTFTDVVACTSLGFILPIKLISFGAVWQDSKVQLSWLTESEINSNHFDLERSEDGQTFIKIATILTHGSATTRANYVYVDGSFSSKSRIYYRLKMVDADNRFSYSDVRVVRVAGSGATISNMSAYPNPATSDLRITLPVEWQNKKVDFEFYDVAGRMTKHIEIASAGQTSLINIKDLETGFYVVHASMGTQTAQQRIIKK